MEENAFFIQNSFFGDPKVKELSFSVEDLTQLDNARLSFLAKKREGILTIALNGDPIFEDRLDSLNIEPLKLDKGRLQDTNVVELSVSSPGFFGFWKTNEYIIDDFKIFADVTETSQQTSLVNFEIKASEKTFLKRARLKFFPSCDPREVGILSVDVNNQRVYSQVPDCDVLNIFDIPTAGLFQGINSLEFMTTRDTYLIDRVVIETELEDNDDLIYYFDLDEDYFDLFEEAEAVCGEFDGVCPNNCDEDDDQDCCFQEYTDANWCDVPTGNENDRCVGRVDQFNFDRCPSGYENDNGKPSEYVEDFCGDDTDGVCPFGCSPFHDQDCCLAEDTGNFWCDDITTIGVQGICVGVVNQDTCRFCPDGYEGEDQDPVCAGGYESRNVETDEVELKDQYDAEVELRFVDDGKRKRGVIRVNDFETGFSTTDPIVTRDISRFVLDGNNYVQIIPENDFNLVNIEVEVTE